MPEELWAEVCNTGLEAVMKTIPKKKKCKNENGYLRRTFKQLRKQEKQKAKEKRKNTHI